MSNELPVTFKSHSELDEYVAKAVTAERERLQERIVAFWKSQHGWIPGAAWRVFADALEVEPERLMTERRKSRQKVQEPVISGE